MELLDNINLVHILVIFVAVFSGIIVFFIVETQGIRDSLSHLSDTVTKNSHVISELKSKYKEESEVRSDVNYDNPAIPSVPIEKDSE